MQLSTTTLANGVTAMSLLGYIEGCTHRNSSLPGGNYVLLDMTGTRDQDLTLFVHTAFEQLGTVPAGMILQYHDEAFHSSYWAMLLHTVAAAGVKTVITIDGGLTLTPMLDHYASQLTWRHCVSDYFFARYNINDLPQINTQRTQHYVSLARFPRRERLELTVQLLEHDLDQQGTISCGWTDLTGESNLLNKHSKLWNLIPQHLQSRFPITLGDVAQQQHDLMPHSTSAVFNIVQESQTGVNSYDAVAVAHSHIGQTPGDRLFFTEKTAKAFAMSQLPIFLSAPGYAHSLRQLGFDLFDDVIDHSYDSQSCVHARINHIVAQLKQLCSRDIGYWQNYLESNYARLQRNRQMLNDMCVQLRQQRDHSIRELLHD
jgi:hypothetical protein